MYEEAYDSGGGERGIQGQQRLALFNLDGVVSSNPTCKYLVTLTFNVTRTRYVTVNYLME